MYKTFKRACCAALTLLAALTSHAASDENGNFIYLRNLGSITVPIKSNSNIYDKYKLYETEPGSNIYDGIIDSDIFITTDRLLFRFIYDLCDDDLYDFADHMNLITPPEKYITDYSCYLNRKGRTEIYGSEELTVIPFTNNYLTAWFTDYFGKTNRKWFRVDLNKQTVFLGDASNTLLILIDDDATPDFDNLENYISANNLYDYIPAGDVKIRFYDLRNKMWLNPDNNNPVNQSQDNIVFNGSFSDSKGEPFVLKDWNGGILKSDGDYVTNSGTTVLSYSCSMDKTFGNSEKDMMYVEFDGSTITPWKGCSDLVIDEQKPLYRHVDGTYKATVTVPDGDLRLRIISGLTDKELPNKVLAPSSGNDSELSFAYNTAYSTAKEMDADKAGYWAINYSSFRNKISNGNSTMTITVTPGDNPSVKFEDSGENDFLYLVGNHNDWDTYDTSYRLNRTPNGGYYGSVTMDADNVFRIINQPNWVWLLTTSEYIDLSNGEYTFTCCSTDFNSGNIQFPGWTGGILYIFVKRQNPVSDYYNVHVSTSPIPDEELKAVETTDSYNFSAFLKGSDNSINRKDDLGFKDCGNGIYTGVIARGYDIAELRIFSKYLPIAKDEKYWEGSYALRPVSDTPAHFDEMGVAEFEYLPQNYLTDEGCEPFRLDDDSTEPNLYSYQVTVDTNKNKVYVERFGKDCHYILGEISDNKYPTYDTRADFKQFRVLQNGAIFDVPAGKLGFSFYPTIADACNAALNGYPDFEVELNEGFAVEDLDYPYIDWDDRHITVNDWEGGKILIGSDRLLDMSTVSKITDEDGTSLTETAPGSLIYKGTVHCKDYAGLSFTLKKYTQGYWGYNHEREIAITSKTQELYINSGLYYNKEENILAAKDNMVTGNIGFNGEPFSIPAWIGEGDIDITVDLNTMMLTGVISKENIGNTYEAVAEGESGLDGVTGYPSSEQENAVVLSASVSNDGTGTDGFNFVSPEGGVITPAAGNDVVVDFDAAGVWTGDYNISHRSNSRRAARARAAQDAKWIINLPEGETTNLNILIDEANSKITIASSAHCGGYFIVPCNESGQPATTVCIENIDKLRTNMLMPNGTDLYEGSYQFDADTEEQYITLAGNLQGTDYISSLLPDNYRIFDLTENDNISQVASGNSSYFNPWKVKGIYGKVTITYDANKCLLTMQKDLSGVEDVINDINGIDNNAPVEYYNLQGIRVDKPSKGVYIRRQGNSTTKVMVK